MRKLTSLKLAPGLAWESLKQGTIYKVCSPSGKYFIGWSTQVQLHRNLLLYNLKHQMLHTGSNQFFGNLRVHAELQKYNPEDFYLDVIEFQPNMTALELARRTKDIIAMTDQALLLNKPTNKVASNNALAGEYFSACHASRTLKDLLKEANVAYRIAKKSLLADKKSHLTSPAEFNAVLRDLKDNMADLRAERRDAQTKMRQLRAKYNEQKFELGQTYDIKDWVEYDI